mgnify:CR=1 FL=1
MRDLNFFDTYINSKKFKIDKQRIYYIVLICGTSLFIFYSLFNQVRIGLISKEVDRLKSVIEDERIKSKIKEIEEKKEELNQLTNSLKDIKLFNYYIDENSMIDDILLEKITSSIPEEIFFTSISMDIERIQIIGKAKDKPSISSLIKNLETIESFESLFVSSISKEEQFLKFILNIQLKDVEMNEVNKNCESILTSEKTE